MVGCSQPREARDMTRHVHREALLVVSRVTGVCHMVDCITNVDRPPIFHGSDPVFPEGEGMGNVIIMMADGVGSISETKG